MSRLDIDDYPGLTIETVSRHLTRLRQLDVIRRTRHVEITNLERLHDLCG